MSLDVAKLSELRAQAKQGMGAVRALSDLEVLKRDWLGKEGTLRALFAQLRDVTPDQKPQVAAVLNEIKAELEAFLIEKERELSEQRRAQELASEYMDCSLPGLSPGVGRIHPITSVERRIAALLKPFGFQNMLGPEIETEYYCFDSLNIPPHHPARDMQDTFYTKDLPAKSSADSSAPEPIVHLLRTHTTSVQARALEKGGLPLRVASFGRVYRNETEDASHQAMFHQFELVWLDQGLTLAHLMGLITHILKGLYGKRRKVRFVPKFYPYTEPSLGPQIDCSICKGSGCSACGGSGWVTVAGAGMVHRNVLTEFKYDPAKVTGFAFGLGTSRLACQLCGLPNLKMAYDNDLRVYRTLPR